jgi:predicted dehydrogenase
MIINLTIPAAHFEVGVAALRAGKSVYSEKPLAIRREDGKLLLQEARTRGLQLGCGPDTFLGGGLQTCRKLIDDGIIGKPVGAIAYMQSRGPEYRHPDPEFLFKVGAGPLFDMGPYYLTALIALMGPVRRVTGSARITYPERTIRSGPKMGTKIKVETPTYAASVLDFASGPIVTLVTSFDFWAKTISSIEISGSEGTIAVPNPDTFAGPVQVQRVEDEKRSEAPLTHGHTENSRGIGAADLAYAIRTGRPHRANGEMAYHVLDVMSGILESSNTGRHVELTSTCNRPTALPEGLPVGCLDE